MKEKKNKHRGSSFDDWLKAESFLEGCTEEAKKRIRKWYENREEAETRLKKNVPPNPNQSP